MRIFLYLLVSSLAGFGAHRFYKPSNNFGARWSTLIRYGIGEAILVPLRSMFRDGLRKGRTPGTDDEDIAVSADVMASVALGIGVLAGHFFDAANGDE